MKQYWVRRWELKVTLKLFGSSPGRFHPWVNNNLCNFPKRQTNSHFKDKGGEGAFLLPNTLSDMVVGLVFLPCFKA